MVDLTTEMAALWAALGPVPPGRARVLQFASARTGEGTSSVAREFARLAAVRADKPVWLIDGDLYAQCQLEIVAAEPHRFGRMGAHASASPDGSCFFSVQPPSKDRQGQVVPDARHLIARPALGGRLWVTRFRRDGLKPGQRALIVSSAGYWKALSRHAGYVIVDAPSLDRGDTAVRLAPYMDATALVVAAETTEAGDAARLRTAIEGAGGRCAGIVLNRVSAAPPPFLKSFRR